jgi:hypothetical protein
VQELLLGHFVAARPSTPHPDTRARFAQEDFRKQAALLAGICLGHIMPPLVMCVLGPGHYAKWRWAYIVAFSALDCTSFTYLRGWDWMPDVRPSETYKLAFKVRS